MLEETQNNELDDTCEKEDVSAEKEPSHNKKIGKRGEDAAARFLENNGYEILERNWKCEYGEADIIAMEGTTLVFVEVKTRSNEKHGFPEDAITPKKRKKYEQIAHVYLSQTDFVDIRVRFDVMALLVAGKNRAFLRHHVNAFGLDC